MTHTEAQLRAMFRVLWERWDGRDGLNLVSVASLPDNLGGIFHASAPPTIRFVSALENNPRSALLLLAHELGHFMSYRAGTRTEDVERALLTPSSDWPAMPESDRRAIYQEESRAWFHARTILGSVGFKDDSLLRAFRRASLAEYTRRLALPEAA